ncbi:MarR family transcriptional regulator [Pasteurellaceae bacterium USgator11]|nr:MarR family transcriptional regulator [Pasteurellaceae bacterium USgator41]TNG95884.1 MarR family transcriptional regulator [Pasteurellaceae bacterium UScroc12]TNG98974.1 MarR family transcriptional regulator [Pasteurellaceae bacterium UScroc31]TNG99723.1 MarR family transcriptional regulator [Pasteurellaceae bacterium USgator11]
MHDRLKLENQFCFSIYSLSKLITNAYRPLLEPLDLTYPQYLVMLVLWEGEPLSIGSIGDKLRLDSGTLTPLLKRLQSKGLINRTRSPEDERTVMISLTDGGLALEQQAVNIPCQMAVRRGEISTDEQAFLRRMLDKLGS